MFSTVRKYGVLVHDTEAFTICSGETIAYNYETVRLECASQVTLWAVNSRGRNVGVGVAKTHCYIISNLGGDHENQNYF